eukprot:GHVN01054584.1.p1 GENE.GHVN01054584.1~~GHVN01054584.1.p1  ORF type:complete len:128 (+),score=2.12 GHVN01054584.1:322-705(+)
MRKLIAPRVSPSPDILEESRNWKTRLEGLEECQLLNDYDAIVTGLTILVDHMDGRAQAVLRKDFTDQDDSSLKTSHEVISDHEKMTSTTKSTACRFFSTPTGCRQGNTCKFRHQEGEKKECSYYKKM